MLFKINEAVGRKVFVAGYRACLVSKQSVVTGLKKNPAGQVQITLDYSEEWTWRDPGEFEFFSTKEAAERALARKKSS